jgi:hypothetical protein
LDRKQPAGGFSGGRDFHASIPPGIRRGSNAVVMRFQCGSGAVAVRFVMLAGGSVIPGDPADVHQACGEMPRLDNGAGVCGHEKTRAFGEGARLSFLLD